MDQIDPTAPAEARHFADLALWIAEGAMFLGVLAVAAVLVMQILRNTAPRSEMDPDEEWIKGDDRPPS